MKFIILIICFIPLSCFAQSQKRINKGLVRDFNTELIINDSIWSLNSKENEIYRIKRKEIESLRNETSRLHHEIIDLKQKCTFIKEDFYKLQIDRLILHNILLKYDSLNVIQMSQFIEISHFKELNSFKNPHKISKNDWKENIQELEYLTIEKQNSLLDSTISLMKIQDIKIINEVNEQKILISCSSNIISELTELNIKYEVLLNSWYSVFLELKKEKQKAKENFISNGPKGFSKEYFQVFPEAFPDYTSEGIKKSTPKKENPKTTKTVIVKPEQEQIKIDNEDNNYGVNETNIVPKPIYPTVQEIQIYEVVDETAQYPGGQEALKKYIKDNIKYPQTAIDMGIEGKCYLKFVVSESGNISNVKVIRGVQDCPECDLEAIRLIKSMPKWKPGTINGKPVNSSFTLPVQFKLD